MAADPRSTLDDHAECMQTVARVEACLADKPDAAWLTRLAAALAPMVDTLGCHFADEAQEALYQEVPLSHPHFADRLGVLLDEHEQIIRRAREAQERAAQLADAEPYEFQEFAAQVHLLVAKIRRHEAEENEIVLEAYWDTLGTGD